jgi:preprotein translocase subunit SecY
VEGLPGNDEAGPQRGIFRALAAYYCCRDSDEADFPAPDSFHSGTHMAKDIAPLLQSPMARRLLFTAGALLVYRLGCQIPVPGLNTEALLRLNGLSLETVSIFALGVTPFLSALFVFEFIKLIVPPLSRWETAKPENTRRLSRYVYYVALVMAGLQARGVASALIEISGLIDGPEWEIPITITLVAGTILLGWFGDRITARGLGNGFWLLVITPTLVNLPAAAAGSFELLRMGSVSQNALAAAYLFLAVATALVVVTAVTGRATTESRVSGADFASVWPPLLATYITSFVVAFFSLQAGGAAHLILIAVLIAAFTWLQSLGTSQPALPPIWAVAAVQILICVGGEWLAHQVALPFAINGSWLIVVVTVMMSLLRSKEAAA